MYNYLYYYHCCIFKTYILSYSENKQHFSPAGKNCWQMPLPVDGASNRGYHHFGTDLSFYATTAAVIIIVITNPVS